MNKPATKDPSMDEILSSIRQIIAEDDDIDESVGTTDVSAEAEADADLVAVAASDEPEVEDAPLALSPEQMVSEPEVPEEELPDFDFQPASAGMETASPKEPDPEPVAEVQVEPPAEIEVPEIDDTPEEIELVVADDVGFDDVESVEEEEVVPPAIAEIAPMPDPDLSADMAENLLAPTTDAAVRHTFSKLNSLAIGGADLTLEAIVRDMLRPMLKEWLDEHLPATVERMVEREIERVSRGE